MFLSADVAVRGGIRTVEVHVLTAEEATMSVLSNEFSGRERVPRVAHSLLNVPFRERPLSQNALTPEVKEGIIERREAFR